MSSPNRLCVRAVDFREVTEEERAKGVGDGRTLEGYAAVFDADTEINSFEGHFIERISKGAFSKTISEKKPVLQFDHGHDARTGSIPIGAFEELREDEHGLFVSARLFDNPLVEPIRQAIDGGAISGMSFRFRVVRDEWMDAEGERISPEDLFMRMDDDEPIYRNIKEVQLFEAGPVVFPAYEQTTVSVRSSDPDALTDLMHQYRALSVGSSPNVSPQKKDDDKDSEKPYGDVEYADPGYQPDGKKRYPIDTKEHAKAAWSYINQADNASAYTAEQLHKIKGAIKGALNKFGVGAGDGDDKKQPADTGQKSLPEEGAVRDEDTPESETPDDAVQEDTSSGHENEHQQRGTETPATETRKERVPMNEPMTVEERVARQSEIKARLAEIDKEYSGAVLPEEVRTEWNGLRDEFRDHDDAINEATERMAQLKELAGDERSRERGHDTGARRSVRRPDNIYDVSEIRNQARSAEEMTSLFRDNAMRAVEQAKFPGVKDRAKAQETVERLLHVADDKQGTLARRILTTGSPVYERAFGKALVALSTNGLTSEEQRAMSLGVDASGGFAVPFQLDPSVILTNDGRINPLRQVARIVQITGKEWQGITSSGITVSRAADTSGMRRVNEATAADDNSPTLAQPTVKAERVQGFVPFSLEIDQDWSALQSEMTTLLNDAREEEEATAFFLGTGVAPDASGIVSTLAAGSVVKTVGAGSFAAADVYGLEEALPPRFRAKGRFMGNKAIYNKVRQFDTAGGAQMWERIGADQPAELLGYPAHEASPMDAVVEGDSVTSVPGTKILLFGDFSQFLIVDRLGMTVELVPHLFNTAGAGGLGYPTGQRGIYAVWRNNARVLVDNAFRLLQVNDGA